MSEFVAMKPIPGQWLVSLDRKKVYGKVLMVRKDGTFTYEPTKGTMPKVDTRSRHTEMTWEQVQYQEGRPRFLDVVPPDFTPEGSK